MTDFFTAMKRAEQDGLKQAYGRKAYAMGFSLSHTGGGCLAWTRDVSESAWIMVTADDGVSLPVDGETAWVGLDASHNACFESIVEVSNTEEMVTAIMLHIDAWRVAREFCDVMRAHLGDNIAEVLRLNAEEPDSTLCHSHDFIDANMTMLDALVAAGYTERQVMDSIHADDDTITRIWNLAWDIAKAHDFDRNKMEA